MIAFGASFLQYLVIMVILVAIAVAGVFAGRALRKRKDAKDLQTASAEEILKDK